MGKNQRKKEAAKEAAKTASTAIYPDNVFKECPPDLVRVYPWLSGFDLNTTKYVEYGRKPRAERAAESYDDVDKLAMAAVNVCLGRTSNEYELIDELLDDIVSVAEMLRINKVHLPPCNHGYMFPSLDFTRPVTDNPPSYCYLTEIDKIYDLPDFADLTRLWSIFNKYEYSMPDLMYSWPYRLDEENYYICTSVFNQAETINHFVTWLYYYDNRDRFELEYLRMLTNRFGVFYILVTVLFHSEWMKSV
jgi:hypothetical protein